MARIRGGRISNIIMMVLLSVITAVTAVAGDNQRILYCADVHDANYPTVQGIMEMSRLLNQRTNGKLKIKIYLQSTLGSEEATLDMVSKGMLDMCRISVSQMAELAPEMRVLLLPYIFENDEHKWRVLEGPIGDKLMASLEKYGVKGLCFQESGDRNFYNSKLPIYNPSNLEGLRIRVQPSQSMLQMVELLGARPVPIHYGEVYAALAAGVLDGAENNIPSYVTSGHCRIAKYFSFSKHASIPEVVVVSQKTFNQLSSDEQKILLQSARDTVNYQRSLWKEFEEKCRLQAEEIGCKFNEVDTRAFQEKLQAFFEKQRVPYKKILSEIEKMR